MTNKYFCFNLETYQSSPDIHGPELMSDRGLAYGHGVFETMLYHESALPLKNQHFLRMITDSAAIGVDLSRSALDNVERAIYVQASEIGFRNGIVKIILTAGSGGRGYSSPVKMCPKLIFSYHTLDENWAIQRDKGIELWRCDHLLSDNSSLVGVKHLNRLDQVLGASEANVQGYVDGLMFNSKGFLIESTCANIFLRTEEHGWLTPSIETAGINGVMRSLLIHEIFPQVHFSLATFPIESEMLCDVTELFICNSARGIVPVTAIRGKQSDRTMRIGNETRALQSKLSELYKCYK